MAVKMIQSAKEQGPPPGAAGGAPPATVLTARVGKQVSQPRHEVTGTLRAVSRSQVAAREAGAVEEVLVDEGETVAANQVIARLDLRRADAQIAEALAQQKLAESMITERSAELERAKTDLSMKKALLDDKAISKREFLDSQSAFTVAEAQRAAADDALSEATSRLTLLELRRADLEIKAPFAGVVAARHAEPGQWLTAGQPVATIVSTGDIEAWLQVPERFAGAVGQFGADTPIRVTPLGRDVAAKSLQRVPDIDPASRLFAAVAVLPNESGDLTPGMSVTAALATGPEEPRLTVPVDAVIYTRMGSFVFRVGEAPEGSPMPLAERVPATVLYEKEGVAYLESPTLNEGDAIVIEGNDRLFPGQPLIAQPKSAAEGDAAANAQSAQAP